MLVNSPGKASLVVGGTTCGNWVEGVDIDVDVVDMDVDVDVVVAADCNDFFHDETSLSIKSFGPQRIAMDSHFALDRILFAESPDGSTSMDNGNIFPSFERCS